MTIGSTRPFEETGTIVCPTLRTAARTDSCSIADDTTCPPAPRMARLTDSVAPAVMISSAGRAPLHAASLALAASYSLRTATAGAYGLEGLKKASVRYGRIAVRACLS